MRDRIFALFWDAVASGLPRDHDLETLRKIVLENLIVFLGSPVLIILAFVAYSQDHDLMFILDLFIACFLLSLFIWLRKTQNPIIPAYIGTSVIGLFYLYLLWSGGIAQTGFVWSFTFPLISIFLLGEKAGIILNIIFIVCMALIFYAGSFTSAVTFYSADFLIRFLPSFLVVFFVSYFTEKLRARTQNRLTKSNKELNRSLETVKELSRLLPICASCKKIRDDDGYWNQIETYLRRHSNVQFSHGVCPECIEKLYPDLAMEIKGGSSKTADAKEQDS